MLRVDGFKYGEVLDFLEHPFFGFSRYVQPDILVERGIILPEILFKEQRYAKKGYSKIACLPKHINVGAPAKDFMAQCGFYILPLEIDNNLKLTLQIIEADFSLDRVLQRAIVQKTGYSAINEMFRNGPKKLYHYQNP